MNWTKFGIGTLIGGIAYFFLGWLFYGILLKDALATPGEFASVRYSEEEFKIGLMTISCFLWGAFITLILMRWASVSTFLGGFKVGAILGFLVALAYGLGFASEFKIGSVNHSLIDATASALLLGITGGLVGWFLGRGKK